MALTIKVNGLTLCHKGSGGISTATAPDVCKTPAPGGPVPIPYPNIAFSKQLRKGTKTVKVDGGNPVAVKGSYFAPSTGDEPGTAGGVKSGTFNELMAICALILPVRPAAPAFRLRRIRPQAGMRHQRIDRRR